ncbi:Lanthionine synthetase C-like protein [Bacteroidales bacterium WCE2008]|nr:Lanthionine synthetase C-like protein [Bacteroidales bacterium WCE2008]
MKWSSLISEKKDRSIIDMELTKIYSYLRDRNDYDTWGVLNGLSGVILYFAEMYKCYHDEEILNALNEKTEILLEHIQDEKIPTFCSGLAGICWTLRYLNTNKLIECDDIDEVLANIDAYIKLLYENYFINNIDFLHGGVGIAYYFLLSDPKYGPKSGRLMLEKLLDTRIENEDGSCMWISPISDSALDKDTKVANLSLSHGMASILAFLAKYYEVTNDPNAEQLIKKIYRYYIKTKNPSDYYSVFSTWIDLNNPDQRDESRLAWCYGDLGISFALNYAGIVLGDKEMIDFSLAVANKTTKRFTHSNIIDASLCHGSSGASLLYNLWYQKTGDNLYKKSALFWLKDAINRIETIDFNQDTFDTSQLNNEYTLLTGLSGVGISFLSLISPDKITWNEILLLL